MLLRLQPSPFGNAFLDALRAAKRRVWLVSPFATLSAVDAICDATAEHIDFRLITRLNEWDLLSGVCELAPITRALKSAQVHAHPRSLHAKVFLVDDIAFIGSANLTNGGLYSNVEAVHSVNAGELEPWFADLWQKTAPVTEGTLNDIALALQSHPLRSTLMNQRATPLRDYAADLQLKKPHDQASLAQRYVLKLNGYSRGDHRSKAHTSMVQHIDTMGAQCFSRKPRVAPGDIFFLCTMYGAPSGLTQRCVYGRGIVDRAMVERDIMPAHLFAGVSGVPPRLTDWKRIVWLRDVEIANCTLEQAPHPYAIEAGDQLDINATRQGSHFFLTPAQAASINDALDRCFLQFGKAFMERPTGIWWNDYLPVNRRLSRE